MTPSIVRNAVQLNDYAALATLLRTLPEGDLRSGLAARERFCGETRFCGEAWNDATRNDHWVISNGDDVVCFTVSGLTHDQARSARVLWDAIQTEYPGIELDTEGLVYIVREVTGGAVWAKPDE